MSTLKADAVTSAQDNTALTLSGTGTGGVKVNDFLIQTKGSDIASDTALTLGKDGNQFDVTGTTTITSIATQGIGSIVTLHFDGVLTFTHHSTNLILPGAANITTAAGDIAVMYEYASADWRCVSYTKASGAAVVAGGGFTLGTEVATTSGTSHNIGSIPAGTTMLILMLEDVSFSGEADMLVQIGDSGGIETSGYDTKDMSTNATTIVNSDRTNGFGINDEVGSATGKTGSLILTLKDSSNFTWVGQGIFIHGNNIIWGTGFKSLSAELTQIQISGGTFDAGSMNIMYI
jgi:hypothetical protein